MPREKLSKPLQRASGYSLDLYCDSVNMLHNDGILYRCQSFAGHNMAECLREARMAGWQIHKKTRTATCRHCK